MGKGLAGYHYKAEITYISLESIINIIATQVILFESFYWFQISVLSLSRHWQLSLIFVICKSVSLGGNIGYLLKSTSYSTIEPITISIKMHKMRKEIIQENLWIQMWKIQAPHLKQLQHRALHLSNKTNVDTYTHCNAVQNYLDENWKHTNNMKAQTSLRGWESVYKSWKVTSLVTEPTAAHNNYLHCMLCLQAAILDHLLLIHQICLTKSC